MFESVFTRLIHTLYIGHGNGNSASNYCEICVRRRNSATTEKQDLLQFVAIQF